MFFVMLLRICTSKSHWEANDFHGQSNKENTFIQINPSLHKDRFQKRVADPDSNEETSQVLVFHK